MNNLRKEALLLIIALLPYLYLQQIWTQLPDQVPTHFGVDGRPNDYSNKSTLVWLIGLMGLGIYLILLVAPQIDPKKKIAEMGEKYYMLRIAMGLIITLILFYALYAAKQGSMSNPGILLGGIGLLFAILGNYFQTVRPNYFIGIRTPWTLESEANWKATHRMAGKFWLVGGLCIIALSVFATDPQLLVGGFVGITAVISVVPIVFSYRFYLKERKTKM